MCIQTAISQYYPGNNGQFLALRLLADVVINQGLLYKLRRELLIVVVFLVAC